MQHHKPPPPESIGFASFFTGAGMTEEELKAEMDKKRLEIWRQRQTRYMTGLFFTPVYGAAAAGLVLAAWRTLSFQFGFPKQPGHWLFVVIASFAILIYARPHLQAAGIGQNTSIGQDTPDFIVAIAMSAVVLIATLFCWRQPMHWQIAFLVLLGGQALQAVAYMLLFVWRTVEPSPFFGLARCVSIAFPLFVLVCAALDFADRDRFDIFHWIGVGTLAAVAAHFIAIAGVPRLV